MCQENSCDEDSFQSWTRKSGFAESKLWVENIVLLGLLELARQPIKSFVQSIPSGGTSRLDVPVSGLYSVKVQLVRKFCYIHCIWKVLDIIKKIQQVRRCFCVKQEECEFLLLIVEFYYTSPQKCPFAVRLTCLLANTSTTAPDSSSSCNILRSSSRASATRSLSLLSTTKMTPGTRTTFIKQK